VNQSLVAERDFLHDLAVGKHREHDVAALRDFRGFRGDRADADQRTHRAGIDVVQRKRAARLREVGCHRSTHHPQADKADFRDLHCRSPVRERCASF
jgi:hypothetical protein